MPKGVKTPLNKSRRTNKLVTNTRDANFRSLVAPRRVSGTNTIIIIMKLFAGLYRVTIQGLPRGDLGPELAGQVCDTITRFAFQNKIRSRVNKHKLK